MAGSCRWRPSHTGRRRASDGPGHSRSSARSRRHPGGARCAFGDRLGAGGGRELRAAGWIRLDAARAGRAWLATKGWAIRCAGVRRRSDADPSGGTHRGHRVRSSGRAPGASLGVPRGGRVARAVDGGPSLGREEGIHPETEPGERARHDPQEGHLGVQRGALRAKQVAAGRWGETPGPVPPGGIRPERGLPRGRAQVVCRAIGARGTSST